MPKVLSLIPLAIWVLYFFSLADLKASSKLEIIKQAIMEKRAQWTAAESWVSKLSREELKRLCGALPESAAEARNKFISLSALEDLPAEFDWRDHMGNWVTPVKNQGACGSCWDFSAIAQVESWWKIKNANLDSLIDLSEQFVLSCSYGSCQGWQVSQALSFIQNEGVPSEECFHYAANDQISCEEACDNWPEEAVKIPGWGFITLEEPIVENIKNAVYRHPVSAIYSVYEDFSYYSGGVYEYTWGEEVGGHAVLIVGWNDEEQSWICKNSWGEYWGEQGFFRIKWANCGIGTHIPFIFDEILDFPGLVITPPQIDLNLSTADSVVQESINLINPGSQTLEYALIDYEVPIMFHPSNFISYQGHCWWCGDEEIGGYENHWLQYLESAAIDISGSVDPKLNFMAYWAMEDPAGTDPPWDGWDGWNVWISSDSGKTFQVAQPTRPAYTCQSLWSFGNSEQGWNMGTGIAGWAGTAPDWSEIEFDLSSHKSPNLIVRFAFASDLGLSTRDDGTLFGLFIDEIKIMDQHQILFYNAGEDIQTMQRRGFGSKAANWLRLDHGVGTIAPFDSQEIDLYIYTQDLAAGNYEANIQVNTNVAQQNETLIPIRINLTAPLTLDGQDIISDRTWKLSQNYPNPFNPVTRFEYQVPFAGNVELSVFTIQGQLIKKIIEEFQTCGTYQALWDGTNQKGEEVASGIYFYTLKADNRVLISKRLIFLK